MQTHLQIKIKDFMNKTEQQQKVEAYFNDKKNQTKSLLLYGPNGTGKSTSMKEYTDGMWNGSALQYASKLAEKGTGYLNRYIMHDMYIDDLGRERTTVSNFGDKINPLHDLIHYRYDIYINHGYKTHISTNLGFKELSERYGIPIADRIKEMCGVVIDFKGESLRK